MNRKKTNPSEHTSNSKRDEVAIRFSEITLTVNKILDGVPFDNYSTINWTPQPIELIGPQFGARSHLNTNNQPILELSDELITQHKNLLEPVLWREAFLLHLPRNIRKVPEASDLGLYCYYRYGLKTSKQRHKFQQLWESVSPPQGYESYIYNPTAGFAIFDRSVNGTFLKKAVAWFEPFKEFPIQMSSQIFTANLEKWIFNHHIILQPIELKILRGLNVCPGCTQKELAKNLDLQQPTVSRIIKSLAERHLLRFDVYENYPVLGLQPITVQFSSNNLGVINSLKKIVKNIRYTLIVQEFADSLLISFVIPKERISRFRQWIKQVAAGYDLSLPKMFFTTERINLRNFDIYNPKQGGWPIEYDMILENIFRLIIEGWTPHFPPLQTFKYSSSRLMKPVKLQPQDFIYMKRATDAFFVTDQIRFYESLEARQAGYRESEHMAYRRRVEFLKQQNIMSQSLGLGMMHIGLNEAVNIFIETPYEQTKAIFSALQLLPFVNGRIFDNGSGSIMILLPSGTAVPTQTSLHDFFEGLDYPIKTAIKPTWKSFGWADSKPINPYNYDFEKGKWIWTKDTLPTLSSDD